MVIVIAAVDVPAPAGSLALAAVRGMILDGADVLVVIVLGAAEVVDVVEADDVILEVDADPVDEADSLADDAETRMTVEGVPKLVPEAVAVAEVEEAEAEMVCEPWAMMLDSTREAWSGASVVVAAEDEITVTVTVTTSGTVVPLAAPVVEAAELDVTAAELDVTAAEMELDAVTDAVEAEVEMEVDEAPGSDESEPGASDPVTPPVAFVASITDKALFSLVQIKA